MGPEVGEEVDVLGPRGRCSGRGIVSFVGLDYFAIRFKNGRSRSCYIHDEGVFWRRFTILDEMVSE